MTTLAGRYRLDREVGRGGMGEVWLAEDTVLGRQVAAKRIGTLPGTSQADLARVRREAQVSAMLNHEHVVAVFDLVEDGGHHWLVMEYVASENLADLVRRRGALSPDEAAVLIAQAAAALAAAHEAGIVHRDVKPSNILVSPEGRVKLSDFGIARLEADQAITQTGLLVGSPAFLAPEVAGGVPATAMSDMWSLGATVFHAVEGRSPYDTQDGNVVATLYRIVNEPPPEPQHADWLTPLVQHLMVHDPEQRWDAKRVVTFLTGPREGELSPEEMTPPPVTVGTGPAAAPDGATSVLEVPASAGRRRMPHEGLVAIVAVTLLVLVVLGIGAVNLVRHDDTPPQASPNGGEPSPSASGPTAAGMTAFLRSYLSTAASDPRQAFGDLTTAYQAESGGYDGYAGFWGTVAGAVPRDIRADPKAMTLSYVVDYRLDDGRRRTDKVTLQVAYQDGRYLIDGDRSG